MTATHHPAPLAAPTIGLAAATWLELGLEALRDGNIPRAAGCLASIDAVSWDGLLIRFPTLPDLLKTGVAQ